MILEQHYLACLAHASYLLADEESKTACVVDPQRDIDVYVESARQKGLAIRHVVLTHFHADFVAGHLELARRTGATIHLGRRGRAEYAFEPFGEGDTIVLGPSVKLTALETPGHTPEGISILVWDARTSSTRPQAVLTGDTLFLGDVGRPDLMASIGVTEKELAEALHESIHGKLARLDDEVLVYPAHGAGSACGKNISKERVGTIGAQRATNWAFQTPDKAEFVKQATSNLPLAPAYFGFAASQNKKLRPTLDESLEQSLRSMGLADVLRAANAGAIVLDTREPDDFARGHLAGSINIGLSGKYASWAGALLDRTKPIVLIANPGMEREAALRLGRIGFDQVQGFLAGGASAFADRTDLMRTFRRWSAAEIGALLETSGLPTIVDIRAASERAEKRIEPSTHIPLEELERRSGELEGAPNGIVLQCAGGYRSSIAASILLRAGLRGVGDLTGGMAAWEAARQPIGR